MRFESVLAAPRPVGGRSGGHDPVLVVIGGLPGGGKTTLLRRLLAEESTGVRGFDSEQVTTRLRGAGVRIPYRVLRMWVHPWHWWRVLCGIRGAVPVVVLTDPWTSPWWRALVLRAARRAGRSVRLVLIDVPPELAESGQASRGRAISARAMRRHTVRWGRFRQTVEDRNSDGGASAALIFDQQRAGRLTLAETLGAPVQ